MRSGRRFVMRCYVLGIFTLFHALLTWPLEGTVAIFGGGVIIAFVAEAVGIHRGLVAHHFGPRVFDVPIYVLFAWPATIYVCFRIALLVSTGWGAVGLAAVIATSYNFATDHRGVDAGYWTYTDDLPGPRVRGVPWWNFLAWFVISSLTAAVGLPFLS